MYPEHGTRIRFTVVEDLGTRVALDAEFHFARIRLSTGENLSASFHEGQFARLKNRRGEIRATAAGQIFAQAPTRYDSSGAIAAAERDDEREVSRLLAEYGRQMWEFSEGRLGTRPEYPDFEAIPHWRDDFKLHAFGTPSQSEGALHLRIDPDDPQPKTNSAKAVLRAGGVRTAWRLLGEFAGAFLSEFERVDREYKRISGDKRGLLDPLLVLYASVASTIVSKVRSEVGCVRQALDRRGNSPKRAPA